MTSESLQSSPAQGVFVGNAALGMALFSGSSHRHCISRSRGRTLQWGVWPSLPAPHPLVPKELGTDSHAAVISPAISMTFLVHRPEPKEDTSASQWANLHGRTRFASRHKAVWRMQCLDVQSLQYKKAQVRREKKDGWTGNSQPTPYLEWPDWMSDAQWILNFKYTDIFLE